MGQSASAPPGPLRLLLPCKPDRAERQVSMGGSSVQMQMLGCDADGVTFAVSHVLAPDAATAPALLAGWRAAVLAHLQAVPLREQPWLPPGGWNVPQSLQMWAQGQRVVVQAAWFGARDAAGLHLYHAVVLAPRARPEAAEPFFSGLAVAP